MRLFLHMPKCGGVSVRRLLESHLSSRLTIDYMSYGTLDPSSRRNEINKALEHPKNVGEDQVIYGHFYPVKYFGRTLNQNYKIVTILRDPIERLVSHYFYWKRTEHPDHYVYRKFRAESWTLEQFIMSEDLKNFYAQFLTDFPLKRFDYIGVYERLEESVRECLRALDLKIDFHTLPHLNSNKNHEKSQVLLSNSFLREAQEFHAWDYSVYNMIRDK